LQGSTSTQSQPSFLLMMLVSLYENLISILIFVTLAFTIVLFPVDDLKQWAARKPFLRRFFDLKSVRIGA